MPFSFYLFLVMRLIASSGNVRLQEMMGIMAEERGGSVFATDERCVYPSREITVHVLT